MTNLYIDFLMLNPSKLKTVCGFCLVLIQLFLNALFPSIKCTSCPVGSMHKTLIIKERCKLQTLLFATNIPVPANNNLMCTSGWVMPSSDLSLTSIACMSFLLYNNSKNTVRVYISLFLYSSFVISSHPQVDRKNV